MESLIQTTPAAPQRTTMNGKPVITVPVKTVLNLDSGFKPKLLCDGPTFSMGDACVYNCSFCYVPSQLLKLDRVRGALQSRGIRHEDAVIRRANALEILRGQLVHPNGTSRFPNSADTRVVYASPLVDVAGNMELVRETVAACKLILQHTHWQIRLLSKSHLLPKVATMLCEEVFNDVPWPVTAADIRARMIFGVSTGTLDDDLAAAFEDGTALVSKRIESLHWLQDFGFRTFGMVCPSLPLTSRADYYAFAAEAWAALRAWKCENVWAEVINVRGESMERTGTALERHGYQAEAALLRHVSTDRLAWEEYNRETFLAHRAALKDYPGKLRYLTYVSESTRSWWEGQKAKGAVIL